MSCTMIFKQRFKPRDKPGTSGLNVAHLQYIATRPGAVFNQGCGFGLWGRLPGDETIRVQTDLERAKQIVREASADHTLYRVVLSVDGNDASTYGLYNRERWEKLLSDHISCIAREMDIKPENFYWCASMHKERHHPHVHILYWDNSNQPRMEKLPETVFQIKAERIRAEFAGDIHREEIRELQQEQREQIKALRTMMQAMCQEACPEETLNLSKLYRSTALDTISDQLYGLLRTMPDRGSLRYAYLPPSYKEKVDQLINICLRVPELEKVITRYETLTRSIGVLYANGKDRIEINVERARNKLRKELGNEVMGVLRELQKELNVLSPSSHPAAQAFILETVPQILSSMEAYHKLSSMLPRERIPVGCMTKQIPGYQDQLKKVLNELASDARLRLPLQRYALNAAQQAKIDPGNNSAGEKSSGNSQREHTILGVSLNDRQWETYKQVYREVRRDLRAAVTQQLRDDAGWTQEAVRTSAVGLLCGIMRIASQAANQRQAAAAHARNSLKTRSRDKSREARKDDRSTQRNPSEWSNEY